MKTDFRKFRRLALIAKILLALLALVLPAVLICSTVFDKGVVGAVVGVCALLVLGIPAAICECAAYDNLICPYCGQRAVKTQKMSTSFEANFDMMFSLPEGG